MSDNVPIASVRDFGVVVKLRVIVARLLLYVTLEDSINKNLLLSYALQCEDSSP